MLGLQGTRKPGFQFWLCLWHSAWPRLAPGPARLCPLKDKVAASSEVCSLTWTSFAFPPLSLWPVGTIFLPRFWAGGLPRGL